MQFSVDDTIAAVASARGGALSGILRVTGPRTGACVDRCFVADDAQRLVDVSRATVVAGRWRCADGSLRLPGNVYWWPSERSYARQPTVEFHTIGSPPLLDAALASVCAAGARLARPGEFTLRAFLAGRLDLTQAEAVLGVIDATGPSQLTAALGQLAGGLAGPLRELREQLLNLLAHVEAGLDFVTEDIEFISADELERELDSARRSVLRIANQMHERTQVGDEPRVVLVGLPNAGKSSLFNALCDDAASLVTDLPGTTRDYVARRVALGGPWCQLIDTAGLELEQYHANRADASVEVPALAAIDRAAQCVALGQRDQAAVELFCLDVTRPLDAWEIAELGVLPPVGVTRLIVLNKLDASSDRGVALRAEVARNRHERSDGSLAIEVVATSSRTGEGLERLRSVIAECLERARQSTEGVVAATAVRCRESLRQAAESLDRAHFLARTGQEELVAAELRWALEGLGEVAGVVYTDDVLDRVFSRFCIGK